MESAAEDDDDDDSVGFDLQILHQSAATGEDARLSGDLVIIHMVEGRASRPSSPPEHPAFLSVTNGR